MAAVASAAMPAPGRKAHILVVGDGINGPVFALAVRQKGFEVLVLEWDMSAICGEGMYSSPIQLQIEEERRTREEIASDARSTHLPSEDAR